MVSTDYLPEDVEVNYDNLVDPTKIMAHHVGTYPVLLVEKVGTKMAVRQAKKDLQAQYM